MRLTPQTVGQHLQMESTEENTATSGNVATEEINGVDSSGGAEAVPEAEAATDSGVGAVEGDSGDAGDAGGAAEMTAQDEGADLAASACAAEASCVPEVKSKISPATDTSFKFFVGGIHPEAWDDDVLRHFSKFGEVKDVQVMKDHSTGRNRGFGFVTMKNDKAKSKIFDATIPHIIKDKRVDVRDMQPEGHSNLGRKVFVGGINPSINEETLATYFRKFGTVEKVTIMRDSEGKSRGFGFVVYESEESSKKVLDERQHQITLQDRVEVRRAEARNKTFRWPSKGQDGKSGGDFAFGSSTQFGMIPQRGGVFDPQMRLYDARGASAPAAYSDMRGGRPPMGRARPPRMDASFMYSGLVPPYMYDWNPYSMPPIPPPDPMFHAGLFAPRPPGQRTDVASAPSFFGATPAVRAPPGRGAGGMAPRGHRATPY